MRMLAGMWLVLVSQVANAAVGFDPFNPFYLLWANSRIVEQFSYTAMASHQTDLPNSELAIMPDGTSSWTQPSDPNFGGYNGRCGEVAAANILTMLGNQTAPEQVAKEMYDTTPGTRPTTMTRYLRANAPGEWRLGYSNRRQGLQHIRFLLRRGFHRASNDQAPFAALIQVGMTALHWVTVVGVDDQDRVVYNDHGTQSRESAAEFVKKWGFGMIGSTYTGSALLASSCCNPYSAVYQSE